MGGGRARGQAPARGAAADVGVRGRYAGPARDLRPVWDAIPSMRPLVPGVFALRHRSGPVVREETFRLYLVRHWSGSGTFEAAAVPFFHDFWCQVAIASLLLFACRDNDGCVPEALGVSVGIHQWALESHLDGPIADENVTR